MGQEAEECPREYDGDMSVRQHLLLQLQVANRIRWLMMIVLAAVLVCLYPEHSLSVFKRLWMFGAFLLYFWFLGAVVGTMSALRQQIGSRAASHLLSELRNQLRCEGAAQLAIHIDYPNALALSP